MFPMPGGNFHATAESFSFLGRTGASVLYGIRRLHAAVDRHYFLWFYCRLPSFMEEAFSSSVWMRYFGERQ
ncbi:MAG: hypothetical protein EGQ81_06630 [Akkermansia sp.]|nr:hypothetical protein [Akkermansia sp.]